MHALFHARSSAKRWGGCPEDYLPIHEFLDSSKEHVGDTRHRFVLHNSFGITLAQRIFGRYLMNSAHKTVPVSYVCEQHIIEDVGFIPSLADWVASIPRQRWMHGHGKPLNYRRYQETIQFTRSDVSVTSEVTDEVLPTK